MKKPHKSETYTNIKPLKTGGKYKQSENDKRKRNVLNIVRRRTSLDYQDNNLSTNINFKPSKVFS